MKAGVDLGGTKTEIAIIHEPDNSCLYRKRVPTHAQKGYQHILSNIAKLVSSAESELNIKIPALGIGTPGTTEPSTGLMKNANTTCLIGQPLHADLENLLKIPVFMANDANCFALAETSMGVVKQQRLKADCVFGVILGTGVGGGVVFNGKVLNGHHGIAGEWGHNFLDESGGPCYCGKTGCVETVLSGKGLEKYYHQQTGQALPLPEIVRKAGQNDEKAQETINRLHYFFGKAIANVINILDPDAIVIGGGVGNIDSIYTEGREQIAKFIFNDGIVNTPVLKPVLGDSAGVFGAAMLVPDKF